MKHKQSLIIIATALLLLKLASATCTVSLDKTSYISGETATADMVCTAPTEKSKDYTLNWTNGSGYSVESDLGVTPSTIGQHFYETYIIPSGYSGLLNATLSGSNLEGNNSANVTSASSYSLIVSDMAISGKYLGQFTSFKATLQDNMNRKVSGGNCYLEVNSNDGSTIFTTIYNLYAVDGKIRAIWDTPQAYFDESTDYSVNLHCFCETSGSTRGCIAENGTAVQNAVGSSQYPFTTNYWMNVSVSVDSNTAYPKSRNTISVNVTNSRSDIRIPLDITFDCRLDRDNNYTRRIRSPFYFPECGTYGQCTILRGISPNTTQQQSIDFIIEEHPYLQGRSTLAYCAVYMNIAEITKEPVTYTATSNPFNITSDEINLNTDWRWISEGVLNSVINLSSTTYNDINGTGTGNIDIRLISEDSNRVVDLRNAIEIANSIANVTVLNMTATLSEHSDYEIEVLEDGNIELEIKNVPLSRSDPGSWFNITLEFYNYILNQTISLGRSATALEGVENKTGTFHMDVDCPSQATIGSDMNCAVTAYVEDYQVVQKEADFTCYITDGTNNYSSVNFNQMVTRDPVTITRSFLVPTTFTNNAQYILQCHADYYNLGKRRDSFYDTFTAVTTAISSPSSTQASDTGGGRSDDESDEGQETSGEDESKEKGMPSVTGGAISVGVIKENSKAIALSLIAFLILLSIICIALLKKKDKTCFNPFCHKHHNKNSILFTILITSAIFLTLSLIVLTIFYSLNYMKSVPYPESLPLLLQDSLTRTMISVSFIALLTIVLFKAFNIRGELKFGKSP